MKKIILVENDSNYDIYWNDTWIMRKQKGLTVNGWNLFEDNIDTLTNIKHYLNFDLIVQRWKSEKIESLKRGKFTVPGVLIRNEFNTLKHIMKDIVVYHIESNFSTDDITYYAYHPSFRETSIKTAVPEYECIINEKPYLTVEWRLKQ